MRFKRFIPVAIAAMTLLPAVSSAQQVQFLGAKFTTMQLGNQFDPGPHPLVGPYEMKLAPNGSPFDIYCIDFDHAFSGNAFQARILSFADVVNASLSFNGTDNFTALKRALGNTNTFPGGLTPNDPNDYLFRLQIEARLSSLFGPSPVSDWDERHYAMWGLFSSNVTPYENDGVNDPNAIGLVSQTDVMNGYDTSAWRIIVDERAWDNSFTGNLEQTTITLSTVPEPGTYALVGVGMIVLAGVARRRNRNTRQQDAGSTQLV